ncbi:hypothetical protein BDR06DRAFT_1011058 [Suillus hirtellus]|nr:hypothetical protein BDR06DRAFT_1011058 [Suillus hirtellus]
MPVKHAKGKTTIPKPTHRSGLNPSHIPADTQMCLSNEKPHEPMANVFNPHDGFSSSTRYDNYNSFSAHAPSGYAPSFHPAHTYDTHTGPSGAHVASSSTHPQADASLSAPAESSSTHTNPLSSTHTHPSSSAHTHPSSGTDMDYTFPNPDYNMYNNSVPRTDPAYQSNPNNDIPPYEPPVFDYESYRLFDVPGISSIFPISTTCKHLTRTTYKFLNYSTTMKRNHWSLEMLLSPSQRVRYRVHKLYTQRDPHNRPTDDDADVTATMHATPSHAGASGDNHYFQVTGPIRDQIFKRSKELVVGIALTKDAMASSTADKKRIIKSIIRKATPKIPGLNGIPRWENQTKDLATIWRAVIVMRTAVTTLTREGIVMAYGLFPPQGSPISPKTFRMDHVRHLIRNNVFMHDYSFNADGTLTIHSKFKNHFILHLVTRMTAALRNGTGRHNNETRPQTQMLLPSK